MPLTCRVGEPKVRGRQQNYIHNALAKAVFSTTFLYVPHSQTSAVQTRVHVTGHREARLIAAHAGALESQCSFSRSTEGQRRNSIAHGEQNMPKDAGCEKWGVPK